ncbi:hypothetical protein PR048_014559 [Dryococelus australis]|uniref:Uncharacterized protein n=1 Tax=Dryococelus australis TaxID=614101 RepID=A0ABQ9HEI8_9NEOP|nr:hypothetical protein PR048_014559 [Dryococelus australis]
MPKCLMQRLDGSPPTKSNMVQFPAGSLPNSHPWESCRWSPWIEIDHELKDAIKAPRRPRECPYSAVCDILFRQATAPASGVYCCLYTFVIREINTLETLERPVKAIVYPADGSSPFTIARECAYRIPLFAALPPNCSCRCLELLPHPLCRGLVCCARNLPVILTRSQRRRFAQGRPQFQVVGDRVSLTYHYWPIRDCDREHSIARMVLVSVANSLGCVAGIGGINVLFQGISAEMAFYSLKSNETRSITDIKCSLARSLTRPKMQRHILDAMARHSSLRDTYRSSSLSDVVWKGESRMWASEKAEVIVNQLYRGKWGVASMKIVFCYAERRLLQMGKGSAKVIKWVAGGEGGALAPCFQEMPWSPRALSPDRRMNKVMRPMAMLILHMADEYITCIHVDLKQGFQKCSFYREQPMKFFSRNRSSDESWGSRGVLFVSVMYCKKCVRLHRTVASRGTSSGPDDLEMVGR